jgi:uncharacterized protein
MDLKGIGVETEFEWDDAKRQANLAKHGIDFEDVVLAMDETAYIYRSAYDREERWIAICQESGRLIAVVFTTRGSACRIISARIARQNERRNYHAHHSRRNS